MPFILDDEKQGFAEVGHKPGLVMTPDADTELSGAKPATTLPDELKPAVLRNPGVSDEALEPSPTPSSTSYDNLPEPGFNDTPQASAPVEVTTSQPPPEGPSLLGAAWRQSNLIGSAINAIEALRHQQPYTPDPEHDPFEMIAGTPYEQHWQDFVSSSSADETHDIMRRLDGETADRQVIDDAGWKGFGASVLVGLADPTMLIPIAGTGGLLARAGAKYLEFARAGLMTGTSVAAAAAVQQAGLQATQLEHTTEESLLAIGGSFVLGGLLGGAAGALKAGKFQKLSSALEDVMRVPERAEKDPMDGGGWDALVKEAQSAGAASVKKDTAELKGMLGVEKAFKYQDPLIRTTTSPLKTVRDMAVQLAETPLTLTRNIKGQTTANVGGSVETMIKVRGMGPLGEAVRTMDELFAQYRFGKSKARFAAVRAGVARTFSGDSRLTYKDFKIEVGKAMARHDKHDIPEVQEAAIAWRKLVFDPHKEEAIKLRYLPEALSTAPEPTAPRENVFAGAGHDLRYLAPKDNPKLAGDQPAWGTPADLHRRSIRGMVQGIEKALGYSMDPELTSLTVDALRRVQPDLLQNVQRSFARMTGNVTDKEIESVQGMWRFVQDMKGAKPTQRLIPWIVAQGGIKDEGGDILQIIGKHKARPFLISGKGQLLDDVALRAWEQRFLNTGERPTVNDLLEAIREDFAGQGITRSVDSELNEKVAIAKDFASRLDQMGIKKAKTEQEAVEQFIEARSAQGVVPEVEFDPELAQSLRVSLEEALHHPSAAPMATRDEFSPQIANEVFDDGGQSYLTRVYNREKIMGEYSRFRNILTDWMQGRQARAAAVATRLESQGFHDTQMLRDFAEMSGDEVRGAAEQAIRHILGQPEGRMIYDLPPAVRGPLRSRTLRIPDELIEDYLERDIEKVGRFYTRTMVPDLSIIRTFGDVDMQGAIAKINDEIAEAANAAKTPAEKLKIQERGRKDINDLMAMADRLRGTFQKGTDPTSYSARTARTVKSLNYLRLMGFVTLSAIPDIAQPMIKHGILSYFKDGVLPLLSALGSKETREALASAGREVKLGGTALDMILDTRAMALADVLDDFGRYSKFERMIESAQSSFGLVSLMAPWNAAGKQWAGIITTANILRACEAVAQGKATAKQIERLAASNIDDLRARQIAEQFAKHGEVVNGVHVANSDAWDISNRNIANALNALRGAVTRDVDRIIVTPGQDKPLWMSRPLVGLVGQFRSFGIASIQRLILSGLQERDAGVMAGILLSVGLGAVSVALTGMLKGKPLPSTPDQWIVNAVDRAGVTGWLFDVNHFAERASGGALGLAALTGRPVSRFASRDTLASLLGPSASLVNEIMTATQGAAHTAIRGERLRETDIRALRRALPYQNLFYASWLFRQLEQGSADALGAIPAKR